MMLDRLCESLLVINSVVTCMYNMDFYALW